MSEKILVLGLGNPLMSDEGIGGFLIERFLAKKQDYAHVDFLDAGTGGMTLLTLMENRKKVIIIDCAFMDTAPGTIKRFTPEDVITVKKLMHYSLHEADILKVIAMAKQLGQCPEEIIIFGIEPLTVEMNQQISDVLKEKIEQYFERISLDLPL